VSFNNLVRQQAATANELLGGLTGTYRGYDYQLDNVTLIVDRDVVTPDDRAGLMTVDIISIPVNIIASPAKGDVFIADGFEFHVNKIDKDDGAMVEAFCRAVKCQ